MKGLEKVSAVTTGKPEFAHVSTWSTGAILQRSGWSRTAALTCLQILLCFSFSPLLQLLALTGVYYSPWTYILMEQRLASVLCLDLKPWCGTEGGEHVSAVCTLGSTGRGHWFRTTGLSGGVQSHPDCRLMRCFQVIYWITLAAIMLNTVLFELWIIFLYVPDAVSWFYKSEIGFLSPSFVYLFQFRIHGWIWPFIQDNLQTISDISVTWLAHAVVWLVNCEFCPPTQLALHHSGPVQHQQCWWRWTDLCDSVLLSLRTPVSDLQEPSSSQPLHTLQQTVPVRAGGYW